MSWQIGGHYTSTGIIPLFATSGLLLDTYPNAAFAYSFRKLRNAYAGSAVRIRESGGNTEADIGFSGNDFDAAAAAAHIGANNGFIVTWYDQSGNGLDVTQSTASLQPAYSASAGVNGLPGMHLDGSDDSLKRGSVVNTAFGTGTECSAFAVLNQTPLGADANSVLAWNAGASLMLWAPYSDDVMYFDFGSNGAGGRVSVAKPLGWDNNDHIVECFRDSADNQAYVVDGTSLVSATRGDDLASTTSTLEIGRLEVASNTFGGYFAEIVFWGTDLGSSNRSGVRTNMNAYYSVF